MMALTSSPGRAQQLLGLLQLLWQLRVLRVQQFVAGLRQVVHQPGTQRRIQIIVQYELQQLAGRGACVGHGQVSDS